MRSGHTVPVIIVLAFAVSALSVASSATAVPRDKAHAAHVRLYDCLGTHYKPTRILVACGDGNAFVQHLNWTEWAAHKARASGVWVQNNCKPDCAGGRFIHYPVRMRLSDVMRRGRHKIFGREIGVFAKRTPPYPAFKHHRIVVVRHGKLA